MNLILILIRGITQLKFQNQADCVLTREDNYLYTLLHLYKHFYCRESCGIRFYCDIYLLLRSNDKLDFDYINAKLKSYGVFEFNNTVVKFVDALFDGASCDEEEQKL